MSGLVVAPKGLQEAGMNFLTSKYTDADKGTIS